MTGHRVAQGQIVLLEAFLILQTATLLGSSALYWAGYRGGRPLLFRYGRLLRLSRHRLNQVERLVTRLGPLPLVIGRQIPGLRLAAPLACGAFRIPYPVFVPAMAVGSSVYIAIFLLLGMWGGTALLGALRLGVEFATLAVAGTVCATCHPVRRANAPPRSATAVMAPGASASGVGAAAAPSLRRRRPRLPATAGHQRRS